MSLLYFFGRPSTPGTANGTTPSRLGPSDPIHSDRDCELGSLYSRTERK